LCNQEEPPVQLTASPEGGAYSGSIVTPDGVFSPEEAPLGWNIITYTYEDDNNCENSAIDSIFVDQCMGVSEQKTASVTVYPNPNGGEFTIESTSIIVQVIILSQSGTVVMDKAYNEAKVKITVDLPGGNYFVRIITSGDKKGVIKELVLN